MVLCRTLARNEHELSIEITPFENFYGICYHLDCPIQTYQKVVFALREKIEKNRLLGREEGFLGNINKIGRASCRERV